MKSLWRSSVVVAAMTLLSRVLGLLRDILLARYFPVAITDPFFAALRIPNTLRRFFAEGGFANAFVPVFSATRARHPEALADLLRHTAGTLLAILTLVSALGMVFAGTIMGVVAYGLHGKPEQYTLAVTMLRTMFPYILLISLTAMAGGVLNTFQRFAVPALTPVLLNLALIIACLLYGHGFTASPQVLAWAVLLGGCAQLALQMPFLHRVGMLLRPKLGFSHPGVKKILRLMVPTLFGSSVGQLTILLNTFLASMFATGSISWLYYSDRLVELPVALIGVALGTVILPRLGALYSQDDAQRYAATLDWSLRWGILIGSAAATGLFVLAPVLLATLFYGGAFDRHDVLMSALSLRAYAFGALGWILVKVLAPAFYARQDTRSPVTAGLIAMSANLVLAVVLGHFFAHVGLAGATAISSLVNVGVLAFLLYQNGLRILGKSWTFLAQVLLSNLAMAQVLHYLVGALEPWFSAALGWRIGHLALLIGCGLLSYALALRLLGLKKRHLVLESL